MRLTLKPANAADIVQAGKFFEPKTGNLIAPSIPFIWPVDDSDTKGLQARSQWSMEQQLDLFKNDPTAHWLKVVDEDADGELVSLARWHEYPQGYQYFADLEFVGSKDINSPSTFPPGINKEAYLDLLQPVFAQRRDWMGTGHYWVLSTVVTREPYRRNGAAGQILDWGLAKAKAAGVSAYLEAAPAAKSTYEKHGFRQVGIQTCKIGDHTIEVARMQA